MDYLLTLAADPAAWVALATLIAMFYLDWPALLTTGKR